MASHRRRCHQPDWHAALHHKGVVGTYICLPAKQPRFENHPAKVFQGIRIAVNKEIEAIEKDCRPRSKRQARQNA